MLQCTDIKKQPTANIIDGNVQLYILSLIPDNFQGVTKIVSDGLPKPSSRPGAKYIEKYSNTLQLLSMINDYNYITITGPVEM